MIERASICEYFTAGPTPLVRQRQARANLAIQVDATVDGQAVTGTGECVLRANSAEVRAQAVRYITEALDRLVGSGHTIPVAGDIAGSLATLVAAARLPAGGSLPPGERRRCILGLESALLELVVDRGLAATRLEGRAQVAHQLDGAAVPAPDGSGPTIYYLPSTGDLDEDLRRMKRTRLMRATHIIAVPESAPHDALARYVARLAKLLKRRSGTRLVLDCSTRVKDLEHAEKLQSLADETLNGPFSRMAGEVLIMVGYGVRTIERLEQVTARGLRAIHFRSAHVGSLLRLHKFADLIRSDHPDWFVAASPPRGGSPLSSVPCQRAAMLSNAVDAFIPDPAPVTAHVTVDVGGSTGSDVGQPTPVRLRYDELIPMAGTYVHLSQNGDDHVEEPHLYPDEADSLGLAHDALRSSLVQRSALAHGFRTVRYSATTFTATSPGHQPLLFGASARSPISSHPAYAIADGHKGAAQALLERSGAPVPEGRIFDIDDEEGALAYAHAAGYPLVTKPASGTGGTGVTLNIRDDEQLLEAFATIRDYPRYAKGDVLVQRHLPGDIYRIVVGDDRVLAAIRRRRPLVVGDGRRSIAELIVAANSPRRLNPRLRNAPITAEASERFLGHQGWSLRDVPSLGEHVYLGTNADGAMWGDSFDVSDELHPSIATAMVSAVAAIPGLNFCGVDVLIEDHRIPLADQQVGICELNSCPELTTPEFPVYGPGCASAHVLFRGSAERDGIDIGTSGRTLRVRLHASGVSDPQRFVTWLVEQAAARGVHADAVERGPQTGSADLSGGLVAVTSLCSLAVKGPKGVRVGRVETEPIVATAQSPAETA